ncbi:MAG: hypothetical protein JO121_27385 [Deltaproteobacteria bacterium]|nr:hypothetical protein [Deltaproteobacteria bacterium]
MTSSKLVVRRKQETGGTVIRSVPARQGSTALTPLPAPASPAIFRQDGEFWTVSYDGKTVRLKDVKGFAYIGRLLSQPDVEIHAIELARVGVAGEESSDLASHTVELENDGLHVGHPGDAGEMLDSQAKAAYRRRLCELREELAEASAAGQVQHAEAIEDEIDALVGELSRATGLGGRDRMAASSSERARQSVTRAIRKALSRIADYHPALGEILERQIKTGTYCSYQPDPNCEIRWSLTPASGDEASCGASGGPVARAVPAQAKGEFDHCLFLADVLGLILEASRKAQIAQTGDALVTENQIGRAFHGSAGPWSLPSSSSKANAAVGNIIVLAINSASLLERMAVSIWESKVGLRV